MSRIQAISTRLARGPTQVAAALLIGQLCTAVALLVLARRLPLAQFGAFATLYSTSLAIAGIVDFGSSQLWTRQLSRAPDTLGDILHDVWRRALLSSPCVVVVAGYWLARSHDGLSLAAVSLLSLQPITYLLSAGWLAGVRALNSPARATWFIAAGNLWLLLLVVVAPSSLLIDAAALGATTSWLLTAALAYNRIRPKRHATGAGRRRSNPWAGAGNLGLYAVFASAQRFDIALVAALSGHAEAGLLAAVSRWGQPIGLLANAVALHQFPDFARAGSLGEARSQLRSAVPLLAFGTVVAVLLFGLAPTLVGSTLGTNYTGAVPILRLVAIGVLPTLIAQPLGSLLQAQGYEGFATGCRAVSTLAFLLIIGLGSRHFGGISAPAAALVANSGLAIVYGYVALRPRHD